IGPDARKMFNTGEDLFHYVSSHPTSSEPDFTPALLNLCRCLEMMLNYELKSPCLAIRDAVRRQAVVKQDMLTAMPQIDLDFELADCEKNMSIRQIASLMRVGKFVNRYRTALLGADAKAVIRSPAPSHIGQ